MNIDFFLRHSDIVKPGGCNVDEIAKIVKLPVIAQI